MSCNTHGNLKNEYSYIWKLGVIKKQRNIIIKNGKI